jgi:SPP1 family predicted phage head-tail adaptor
MADRLMPPGARDRLVDLEKVTDAVGASGLPTESWSTLVASMPASKDALSGRERLMVSQMSAQAEVKFTINYRLDMDPDMVDVPKQRRVRYQGRIYDVTYAREVGRRQGIELFAMAKVG